MSEIKLLPCPFCGGAVRVVEQYNTSNGKMEYLVRCKDISCTVRPKTEWFDELEEAIRHWNTRKPMREIVEKIKEKLLQSINNANDESIENGHTLDFEHYFGEKEAYEDTLLIVKEVGGLDV